MNSELPLLAHFTALLSVEQTVNVKIGNHREVDCYRIDCDTEPTRRNAGRHFAAILLVWRDEQPLDRSSSLKMKTNFLLEKGFGESVDTS
jgi:hypothetical protein